MYPVIAAHPISSDDMWIQRPPTSWCPGIPPGGPPSTVETPLSFASLPARPWNWPDGRNSWTLCIWTRRWTLNKVPEGVFSGPVGSSSGHQGHQGLPGSGLDGQNLGAQALPERIGECAPLSRECHPQTSEVRFPDVCFCIQFGNYATWYA